MGTLWQGNFQHTMSSPPNDKVTVTYPTNLQGVGYIMWSVHDEYRTWYRKLITISGTSSSDPTTGDLFMDKASSCSSPISLSVVNNIRENLPISVTSGANLDSTTASAIGFPNKPYVHPELDYYFEVETTLHLRIYKYNATTSKNVGSPINSEDVIERIYYDEFGFSPLGGDGRGVERKTVSGHCVRAGLKPLAQCVEVTSTGSVRRLRADCRVRFERTSMN